MKLAKSDITELLTDLRQTHRPPPGSDLERMTEVYHRALADFPLEAVRAAFERYVRDGSRFWPKPGAIRALAKETKQGREHAATDPVSRYWAWERGKGDASPCPCCGAKMMQGRDGRLQVYHDGHVHEEAGIPYVGPRDPRPLTGVSVTRTVDEEPDDLPF